MAAKAIEAAGHAADLLAWRQERAERLRAAEEQRRAAIAAREAAIEDATIAYLLAAQAKERIMAEALARCAEHDKAAATAVAGLREAGLTRADIAQITGASAREVAGLLGGAHVDDAEPRDAQPQLDAHDDIAAGRGVADAGGELSGGRPAGGGVEPVVELGAQRASRTDTASQRVQVGDLGPEAPSGA